MTSVPSVRKALLLLALACAACRLDARDDTRPAPSHAAADTTASPDSVAAVPAPSPPTDPPGTTYLAWSADSAHAETVWLAGDGTARAARPQVVVAAGGGLWAWTERMRPVAGADCRCLERRAARDSTFDPGDPPPGTCPTRDTATTVVAVDLLGGRELRLLGLPGPAAPAEAPPGQDMVPIGSVGPYLFAETSLWSFYCGAIHGNTGRAFPVFDLAHGGREVEVVQGDTFRMLAAQARQARTLLAGRAFTPLQSFSLTAVEPRWRADGGLEIGYRFAADACWACGDEHAEGYFASERVAGPVPPLLRTWASAPLPVRRWWSAHPPAEHAGWSAVPPADTAHALRRFRAR